MIATIIFLTLDLLGAIAAVFDGISIYQETFP
jgi:hypothetical protein